MRELHVYTDSDWAGCDRSRRSTSGGVVVLGGAGIKHWSVTQPTVALSSGVGGGGEYAGTVTAATEGFGVQALASDLGWNLSLVIHTDSSAAQEGREPAWRREGPPP